MLESIGFERLIEQYRLIETKHISNNDWVITVVLNSYGDYIEVKQVEDYLTSVLMIGDNLQCKFITKETIYLFDAEVYNIKLVSRSIVLKVFDVKTMKNNRKHARYEVYLSSSLKMEGFMGECYCVVVNVSIGGLSIITRCKLGINDKVNLSMYINGFSFLTAECFVEWTENMNRNSLYGLSIINMDELSRIQYSNFIKKLQRKERLLRKKGEKIL